MRVLHLNTHASGGSYQYAALLSIALMEQGIESRVLCKNSQLAGPGRVFLDRVIRRSYVSFSTEPWHGTRRLLPPPSAEDLKGVDVLHLHVVADWFDVPGWLETLPGRIGVVIGVHGLWHFTGGCFLYRGCDRYRDTLLALPDFEGAFQSGLGQRRAPPQVTRISEMSRPVCGKQPLAGGIGQAKSNR